jgi:thiamine biosynthesis lipoprotein
MGRAAGMTFPAFGTTASVLVTEAARLPIAVGCVRREIDAIDRTCSRFRRDSELEAVNAASGSWISIGPLLMEAVTVALRAARLTGGAVDPTVGSALVGIGYDRDFDEIERLGLPLGSCVPAPGWRTVQVDRRESRIRTPPGVKLDLGATAKALAADRCARSAAASTRCGVLVSLGGDISIEGEAPVGGWSVGVADSHLDRGEPGETVRVASGGMATSSTTFRRWTRGGETVHHVIDPWTGRPAREVWRTVSVAARSCADANTASTAAIVRGEAAAAWLEELGLPARLVGRDGGVVRTTGWPMREAA